MKLTIQGPADRNNEEGQEAPINVYDLGLKKQGIPFLSIKNCRFDSIHTEVALRSELVDATSFCHGEGRSLVLW